MMIYEFFIWTADWEINAKKTIAVKDATFTERNSQCALISFKFTERKQIVFAIL